MKKKILLSALFLTIIVTISACNNNSSKTESQESQSTQSLESTSTPTPDFATTSKVYDSKEAYEKYSEHPFIPLWDSLEDVPFAGTSVSGTIPKIIPYIAQNNTNGGCVIICPGGGYIQLAVDKEGKAPAAEFNENNITAFVLQYRVNSYKYDAIMSDVFRAIRYVRANADDFGINPDKIAIMGFSAGGHLATMALEHYDEDTQSLDEIDKVSAKPNYGILCYPVISLKDEKTHELTRKTFLGSDDEHNTELIKKYSGEDNVSKDMSPVFIWHCEPDNGVPVENSEDFASAMDKAKVPYEMHIYKTGAHGLGLAKDNEEVSKWFPDCIKWLNNYGY